MCRSPENGFWKLRFDTLNRFRKMSVSQHLLVHYRLRYISVCLLCSYTSVFSVFTGLYVMVRVSLVVLFFLCIWFGIKVVLVWSRHAALKKTFTFYHLTIYNWLWWYCKYIVQKILFKSSLMFSVNWIQLAAFTCF